ncbi:MAG: C40 family peptidase [Deltaproteobacteria bacterium]|nr:C40 family peptidase [Deltaproteobacteria bacterium]
MGAVAARLKDAIAQLRVELRERYPVLVDDTSWSVEADAIRVRGSVLVPSQALAYQKAIGAALARGVSDVPRPLVLTDLSADHRALRWARLVSDVDLFGSPDEDNLQTQWAAGAWVRSFLDEADRARVLIQLPDGTVGWVTRAHLAPATPQNDPWEHLVRSPAGSLTPAARTLGHAAAVARDRLGRPYRWGGNTLEAADCSGFVQSVVLDAGVLMPKNTRDQMRRGVRVAQGAIDAGDLVFVKGREKALMHVGLALPDAENSANVSVIHSCLSRARVLEESLPDFLERYRFVAARRVVSWADAP